MTGVPPSGSGHSAEPEPSCTVSAVPVSIPNAKPRRAHVLKIEFGANTLDDLCYALKQTALDLRMGHISTRGCSGSPSVGFSYEYDVDESWTKDRYFTALEEWLDASAIEGESAVPKGDANA